MLPPTDDIKEKIKQLFVAVKHANINETETLVKDLGWRCFKEDYAVKDEEPLLHLAINSKSPQIVDLILSLHINRHPTNSLGQCPITALVHTQKFEFFAKYLFLCRSACIDKTKKTALSYAIELNENEMAQVLYKTIPVRLSDLAYARKSKSQLMENLMVKADNFSPLIIDLIIEDNSGNLINQIN